MRILFCLFLAGSTLITQAQNKDAFRYQTAIGFSPLALAQVDFTFMGNVETRLKHKLFFAGEAGYIFASLYISNPDEQKLPARGFIIKPSLKIYMSDKTHVYLQPQLFYKQVTHQVEDWLDKELVNGVSSYQQFQRFRYRRTVYGANLIWGVLLPLDRRQKAYFDIFMGLGVRRKEASIVGEPRSAYRWGSLFFAEGTRNYFPSFPAGIRFLFTIQH